MTGIKVIFRLFTTISQCSDNSSFGDKAMVREESNKDSKTETKEPKVEHNVRKSNPPNKNRKQTGNKEGTKGLISDKNCFIKMIKAV